MARLFLPGGPPSGFELRETDRERLERELRGEGGEETVDVLLNDERKTAQVVTVWPSRLAWYSIQ